MRKLLIFTDIGDTIIDESTEQYDASGTIVLQAECIPGAEQLLHALHEEGFRICMVADGMVRSFHNTMNQHHLSDVFNGWIISEHVGEDKPSPAMFQRAMDVMGLRACDKHRVIMVGNNLSRDIYGGNAFGIRTVYIDWSPRRSHTPANALEEPTYRIHEPGELKALVEKLESEL